LSRLQQSTIAPDRLIEPNVGLRPVAPHRAEGETIEPNVSVPTANGNKPATTEAAEPAEEPLDPCFKFHGFFVSPPKPFIVVG
jgi:hypothetical protein